MFKTVKDKFCDKTNPLDESENDCDDDDMGPTDSVSLIAASSSTVTSSKSSIVKQIELEHGRSELQFLEELARSRKVKVEAEAKAAEAKVKAEAEAAAAAAAAALAATAAAASEEEETLTKLRLQAIERLKRSALRAAQRLVLSFPNARDAAYVLLQVPLVLKVR